MRTTSKKDSIYLGKNAGLEIMDIIKRAKKSVKVVSPYLSSSYLQELIKLHREGREITLITCDTINEESGRFSNFKKTDLINKEKIFDESLNRKRTMGINISLIISLISSALLSLSFIFSFLIYTFFILSFAVAFLIYFYYYKPYKMLYTPLFRIKVFDSKSGDKPWSTQLIHSKIFIIDENICFLGSANFTYSGFKTHYESVIKIIDVDAVNTISHEVENLFNSNDLREKPIEEWIR